MNLLYFGGNMGSDVGLLLVWAMLFYLNLTLPEPCDSPLEKVTLKADPEPVFPMRVEPQRGV